MTLEGLLQSLGQIAIHDNLVNWAGAGTSIYAINDLTVRDYPCFFASPTGTNIVEDNVTRYNLTLFWFSRLAEDNSNDINVQSTAVEALKNIIRKARFIDGIVEVAPSCTITIFQETERFKDRCTGAYAQIDITIVNDTVCPVVETDAPDSGDTYYFFVFDTPNNQVLPATATSLLVEWRTNYEELTYKIISTQGIVESGELTGRSKLIEFPENKLDYQADFQLNVRSQGKTVGQLFFSQQAAQESDFFYFITPDMERVAASATSKTILYRTDKSDLTYELYRNGDYLNSGTCNTNIQQQTGNLLARFARNTSDSGVTYMVKVYQEGEEEVGSISFFQDAFEYYFRFITADNQVLPADSTDFTIYYQTNLEPPIPYTYNSPYGTFTGESDNNISITISFPENETFERLQNSLDMGGQTMHWYQEAAADTGTTFYINYVNAPTHLTNLRQLVSFTWATNCNGKVKYALYSGSTQSDISDFVRSGRTDSLTGDSITFSANTDYDIRYYRMELHASNSNNVDNYVASAVTTFYQDAGNSQALFTDPNRTIMDSPAPNQIFYKTVSGVVREVALYLNAKDPEGNMIRIISNTYPDPEGYGTIQYDGPLYQGWPFFPSDMIRENNPVSGAQAVTEVILPEGYGVLSNYDRSEWGVSDRYLKSVYIPNSTVEMYPTDCIENNLCSLENVIIPAGVQGGLGGHGVKTINQKIHPSSACQGIPNIYYNSTIENYHKMSPHSDYWQMANTGALIHCLDGDTYQR